MLLSNHKTSKDISFTEEEAAGLLLLEKKVAAKSPNVAPKNALSTIIKSPLCKVREGTWRPRWSAGQDGRPVKAPPSTVSPVLTFTASFCLHVRD